jgi:hypothetical protein
MVFIMIKHRDDVTVGLSLDLIDLIAIEHEVSSKYVEVDIRLHC